MTCPPSEQGSFQRFSWGEWWEWGGMPHLGVLLLRSPSDWFWSADTTALVTGSQPTAFVFSIFGLAFLGCGDQLIREESAWTGSVQMFWTEPNSGLRKPWKWVFLNISQMLIQCLLCARPSDRCWGYSREQSSCPHRAYISGGEKEWRSIYHAIYYTVSASKIWRK